MAMREYRSNMFSMLLREQCYALELYNALNNSDYKDEKDVEIFCLENGISLSVRNDASFLVDDHLNIYEQQSTVNPNMPLRSLIYVAELLKEIIEKTGANLFDSKLIRIPNPRFVVFYNGRAKLPEIQELRLSEAYINKENAPELELRCTVYNINPNNNESLKEKSLMLHDYMEFVEAVNARGPFGSDKNKLREVLETVIEEFIRDDKLSDFLRKHGKEVVEMETLDFTFERREELIKKSYYEDGINQGLKALVNSLKKHYDDFQSLYREVVSNEEYENCSEEQVRKYY